MTIKITELFLLTNLCSSKKEAKRLIAAKALKVNNITIEDPELEVSIMENKLVIGYRINNVFLVHNCCLYKKDNAAASVIGSISHCD